MPAVFFTSDTHFDHDMVAGLRGYGSPAEHDEAIVRSWNKVVRPQDTVWHLGDVTLRPIGKVAGIVSRLNGTIHLVAGNHDKVAPGVNPNAHRVQRDWLEFFASIQPFARLRHQGRRLLLSHYPYSGEGDRPGGDRFTQYRLPNEGIALVHGHTHDPDQRLSRDQAAPMVHVGWDAWRRPVSISEVVHLLAGGSS